MNKIRVRLVKEGSKVPNPATARPLEFGKVHEVPDAPYWRRRIRDGVVKLVTDEPKSGDADNPKLREGAPPRVREGEAPKKGGE